MYYKSGFCIYLCMSKFCVPIYLADIIIEIKDSSGKNSTVTRYKIIKDVIIKGYSIDDMLRRKKELIMRSANTQAKQKVTGIQINLISQHGYGVED